MMHTDSIQGGMFADADDADLSPEINASNGEARPAFIETRSPPPYPDSNGYEWHRDYLGRWVNLWGLRPRGEADNPRHF